MDQVGPSNQPIDRILLFREGKEPVVFAEKLNAVFGMAWHDGALYVMNMPRLTVLRDTDGDGKADRRKDLFTDLGPRAHRPERPHRLGTPVRHRRLPLHLDRRQGRAQGDRTRRPDRPAQAAAAFSAAGPTAPASRSSPPGTRNHLEPNLDARDNLFTYDNTDDGDGWWTRVTHHIDGGYYGYPYDYHDRPDRMLDRMAEYGGGSPCGGLVYKEDAWPEQYRGRRLLGRVGQAARPRLPVRARTARPSRSPTSIEFVEPGDVGDFRPLDLALSYDGKTLYIADWGMGGWGNKTEKVRPGLRRHLQRRGQDPPAGQGFRPDRRRRSGSSTTPRSTSGCGRSGPDQAGPRSPRARRRGSPGRPEDRPGRQTAPGLGRSTRSPAGRPGTKSVALIEALDGPAADVRAQAARALGERGGQVRGGLPGRAALERPRADGPAPGDHRARADRRRPRPSPPCSRSLADDDRISPSRPARPCGGSATGRRSAEGLDVARCRRSAPGVLITMEMVYERDAAEALARVRDATRAGRSTSGSRPSITWRRGIARRHPWDGKWWGTRPTRGKPPAKTVDWEGTPLVLGAVRDRLADPPAPSAPRPSPP